MLTVKTQSFEKEFKEKRKVLTLRRNQQIRDKGSFSVLNYGDFISDIDMEIFVHYNPNLPKGILKLIKRAQKNDFEFLCISAGIYDEYKVPWTIDSKGGCDFNPNVLSFWLKKISRENILDEETFEKIQNILTSNNLYIHDLIEVEKIMYEAGQIYWLYNDIQKGYKEKNGKKYVFLTIIIQEEAPVLEFFYKNTEEKTEKYVPVDLALTDRKFFHSPKGLMYRYYTNDWYKILKSFRWRLNGDIKNEYLLDMKKINKLSAIYNLLKLAKRMKDVNYYNKTKIHNILVYINNEISRLGYDLEFISTLEELENNIYTNINSEIRSLVNKYIPYLPYNYANKIIKDLERARQAKIGINQEELKNRYNNGNKCPFFVVKSDNYDEIAIIANKINYDISKFVDCMITVSQEQKVSIEKIVQTIKPKNENYLLEFEGKIHLYNDSGELIREYDLENKKKAQLELLLGK